LDSTPTDTTPTTDPAQVRIASREYRLVMLPVPEPLLLEADGKISLHFSSSQHTVLASTDGDEVRALRDRMVAALPEAADKIAIQRRNVSDWVVVDDAPDAGAPASDPHAS
jgi:hypothetical protein